MSTPVVSISTVTAILGTGRFLNSLILCKGRSTVGLPVIFCTKSSPCRNSSRQILYASKGKDFAEAAEKAARELRDSINGILEQFK